MCQNVKRTCRGIALILPLDEAIVLFCGFLVAVDVLIAKSSLLSNKCVCAGGGGSRPSDYTPHLTLEGNYVKQTACKKMSGYRLTN